MPRTKSDTIESMGVKSFLNDKYGRNAYDKFLKLITSGEPDSEIAKAFSTPVRKLTYQTAGNWRRAYIAERGTK